MELYVGMDVSLIANDRHSERNRVAVMLSFLAGLRVGEIAALSVGDVVDGEGRVRDQLQLNPGLAVNACDGALDLSDPGSRRRDDNVDSCGHGSAPVRTVGAWR